MPAEPLVIGYGEHPAAILPKLANRHGLITGATGTGKSVTLMRMAEAFSSVGVPVFMADVKGDLAGLSQAGGDNPKVAERVASLGISDMEFKAVPTILWDLFGEQGHPIRGTVSDMGPLLLARLLSLNETQEGVLNLAFKLADDEGLLLLDLNDLRSMLTFVADNAKELQATYGNVSSASIGAIQRALLVLEQQGADQFFGEPALKLEDLMRTDYSGHGYVSILAAERLMQNPRLYSTFLLWLLSELFEDLPEVGDLPQPKLVFFFDEAHLLFSDSPKALLEKIEQVVRLIRSKGIGVYFVSQNPLDVLDIVLGQLGNRVQHALRAFTPRDQKAVDTAAETFRPNPAFKTSEVITQLGVGEALVSLLEEGGAPSIVQRVLVRPPGVRLGTLTPAERQIVIDRSPAQGLYEDRIDRESAHERLLARAARAQAAMAAAAAAPPTDRRYEQPQAEARQPRQPRQREGFLEAMTKSVVRSAGSQLGRRLMRGVLGSIFKGN